MITRVDIIAGFIHQDICDLMIAAAQKLAPTLNCKIGRILWIPGSMEAPFAAQELIRQDRPDAMMIFGVQQKGKTKHGEIIAHQVTSKLLDIQITHRIPMAIAIIGPQATLVHAKKKAVRTAEKALRAVQHMKTLQQDLSTKPPVS